MCQGASGRKERGWRLPIWCPARFYLPWRLARGAQLAGKVTRAALCRCVEPVFLQGHCFESSAWAGDSEQRDLWPWPGRGRTSTWCMDSHVLCRTPCTHFHTSCECGQAGVTLVPLHWGSLWDRLLFPLELHLMDPWALPTRSQRPPGLGERTSTLGWLRTNTEAGGMRVCDLRLCH